MSQSLSQIWVHIVFSTKDRYPFLKEVSMQERLHQYIKSLCNEQGCNVAAIGGVEDHVHILVCMSKKITLCYLVEKIKKSSSKWIKSVAMNNVLLAKFYWQNGYGAFSVSQSNLDRVKMYIKNQRYHHQTQSFEDEFKKILIRHGVNYDERYLFT